MKKTDYKAELEKLRKMNNGDRAWYIWEYYKIQILAFVLIVFAIYEVGACIYRNLQDTMLYCVMINEPYATSSAISAVQKEFEARNGIDATWKMDTEFDSSMTIEEDTSDTFDFFYSSASTIKFESLIATDTVDVLITVPDMYSYYASQNLFLPLDEVLPEELYVRLEADGRLVAGKDYDGNTVIAGISLDDSYLSEQLVLSEGSSLSICTTENHVDMIIDFIEYALGM